MTITTELAQRMREAAEKATPGEWVVQFNDEVYSTDSVENQQIAMAFSDNPQRDAEFIALANPVNVLALLDALEVATDACNGWQRKYAEADERLRAAESGFAPLTVERLIREKETLEQRIAQLEAVNAAAEKLVRCKGRYHSELNYRALAALFGVTAPDLQPLDGEARTEQQPVSVEAQRNPVLAYADSYRDMAKQGVESIPVWSVITDLERNIAPLYTAQPAPAPITVKLPEPVSVLHRRDYLSTHTAVYAYPAAELNAALATQGIKVEGGVI